MASYNETCSCGAEISVDVLKVYAATDLIESWRTNHRHEFPPAAGDGDRLMVTFSDTQLFDQGEHNPDNYSEEHARPKWTM